MTRRDLVRVEFWLMFFAVYDTVNRFDFLLELGTVKVVVRCHNISNVALYSAILFTISVPVAFIQKNSSAPEVQEGRR